MLRQLIRFGRRLPFADKRVGVVGQFGEQQEVIPPKAIGIPKSLLLVHVGPGERDIEERAFVRPVFPNRRFDAADSERLHGSWSCGRCGATGR